MDETGLNHRARPVRTLDKQSSKGSKISKERITLALTCNSIGTERFRPLVIHTSKNRRSFKQELGFDVAHYVDYHFNKKAWMTQEVRTVLMLSSVDCCTLVFPADRNLSLQAKLGQMLSKMECNVQSSRVCQACSALQRNRLILKSFISSAGLCSLGQEAQQTDEIPKEENSASD